MHRTYIAYTWYTITQYIITYLLLGCRGGIFNFPTTTTNHNNNNMMLLGNVASSTPIPALC